MPSTALSSSPNMAHDILDNKSWKTKVKLEEFDQSYYNTATTTPCGQGTFSKKTIKRKSSSSKIKAESFLTNINYNF